MPEQPQERSLIQTLRPWLLVGGIISAIAPCVIVARGLNEFADNMGQPLPPHGDLKLEDGNHAIVLVNDQIIPPDTSLQVSEKQRELLNAFALPGPHFDLSSEERKKMLHKKAQEAMRDIPVIVRQLNDPTTGPDSDEVLRKRAENAVETRLQAAVDKVEAFIVNSPDYPPNKKDAKLMAEVEAVRRNPAEEFGKRLRPHIEQQARLAAQTIALQMQLGDVPPAELPNEQRQVETALAAFDADVKLASTNPYVVTKYIDSGVYAQTVTQVDDPRIREEIKPLVAKSMKAGQEAGEHLRILRIGHYNEVMRNYALHPTVKQEEARRYDNEFQKLIPPETGQAR